MPNAPIILVPGFWLGAWAWDEVATMLRGEGHEVTVLTLPGMESPDADRSTVTLSDHVDAIVDAVRAAPAPVVLAVHSASGFSGYAASDRVPERIAAMVYVDTAPGISPRTRSSPTRRSRWNGRRSRRRRTSTVSTRSRRKPSDGEPFRSPAV
jgi:pimeloyl-ACP methyl ester carboxylesterase